MLVKYGQGRSAGTIEVATFRSDGSYSDRRRPDAVYFSDPLADAQRRDFTVNALFLDPVNDPTWPGHVQLPGTPDISPAPLGGSVVDFVGGRADLSRQLLRAVGDPDQRLAEDHLRALRAARLATKLDFRIDPATADAVRRHAAQLGGVSRERIGDELRLMLGLPQRADAVAFLHDLHLDAAVLMETEHSRPAHHPRASASVLAALPADASYPLSLAAWAIDRGVVTPAGPLATAAALHETLPDCWHGGPTRAVRDLCSRWRTALCLSNDERDALLNVLAWAGLVAARWDDLREAHRRRAAASRWFGPSLVLVEAMSAAGLADRTSLERVRTDADTLRTTGAGLAPDPLVSGDDLTAAGFVPGPGYRRLLEALYDAQLESRIESREQGLELARSLGV